LSLTGVCKELMDQSYVCLGGGPWSPAMRDLKRNDIHSSDPVRKAVHNSWCFHDESLQVGNITYVWLHEANLSCARVQKKDFAKGIDTPCLFALPGKEKLVSNRAARKLARNMPNTHILELPDSKHEILMECDSMRNEFLTAFLKLMVDNDVKEKLKPF